MKAALFTPVPYAGPAKWGTWPTPATDYSAEIAERSMRQALEQFELADQVGFDWVTVAEHHYAPLSLTPAPMLLAGALAERVKRARIAVLGASLPIQNPVRVAEELAMIDTLTGGRLVAGLLRGTSNEYATYGTNPAESRERFEEGVELVLRAWTEPEPFGWQGRYYEFRAISIWPRPVQQPHPPLFMSGSSPESAEFAARNRIGLGLAITTLPRARESAAHYREHAAALGWQPSPDQVLYRLTVHVAESDEEALADMEMAGLTKGGGGSFSTSNRAVDEAAARAGYYGRETRAQRGRLDHHGLSERVELGQLLLGGPETVLEQVRAVHKGLRPGILDLVFAPVGHQKTLRAIELFGTRVLPGMRVL